MPQTLAIVATVATIAGAGYSAYSSYQQGKTADAISQYNAHQQELSSKMQMMGMQAQAKVQEQQASAQRALAQGNFMLRQAEANARFANATAIENTAEGQSRSAREGIRRKASEFERFQGTQRANIAKNGLVESTGTPLDILADTARGIQLEREDSGYADRLNRDSLFREADLERLGGRMALAGASLDRSSEVAAAGLTDARAGLTRASAQAEYRSNLRQAEIMRLTGGAQKEAFMGQIPGTLLSAVGPSINTLSSVKWGIK